MTLTFPTIAEQVAKEFRDATKTVSVATLARKRGATVERTYFPKVVVAYTFDDDTTLVTRGRGKSYEIETLLP